MPIFWPTLQDTDIDWQYKPVRSDKFCQLRNGTCPWPRGKMLGGSSSMNAMLYVRGNRRDYDRWRDDGNPGWGYEDILPYFMKSEDMRITSFQNNGYHKTGGYLTVEYSRHVSGLRNPIMAAADELGLLNDDGDYNGASQLGFAQAQQTLRDGRRCSNNKAFIRSASYRKNLDVILNSHVTKIIIDANTKEATGVQFVRQGVTYRVRARKEVLLSAGAVQSPQILMLSGIGPASHLHAHDIPVIANRPGVGQNLQEHIAVAGDLVFVNASSPPLSYISPTILNNDNIDAFVQRNQGPFCGTFFDAFGFVNSPQQARDNPWPDLQVYFFSVANSRFTALIDKQGITNDGFLMYPSLTRPLSRGTITLRSSNPFDYPIIDPKYFDNPQDFKVLVKINISTYLTHCIVY